MNDAISRTSPVEDPILPWQQALWAKLIGLQSKQRLPHALLLSGTPGVGKMQLAGALARYLLCLAPGQHACGRCKGCLLNEKGSHPDLVLVEPEEPGKPIKIDQIRELNSFISNAAQQGGYRVLIIHPAEEMNINASNALLKGLEEPGERTLFILISQSPGRLLPTIRSRCQVYPVDLPEREQALAWLQSHLQDPEQAPILLGLAAGAPLQALRLHEEGGLTLRRQWLKSLAQVASGKQGPVDQASGWLKEDVLALLGWWQGLLADLIRYQQLEQDERLRNLDASTLIPKLAARSTPEKLFAFTDKMQEYRLQIISKANPNKQLMLEDLLIGWSTLFRT